MSSTKENHNKKKIANNTIALYVRFFVVMLVTLYSSRIVLRELGVVDYGIYNVVAGFVAMFSFFSSSMSNAVQRYLNFEMGRNNSEGLKNVYSSGLLLFLGISIIMVLLLETIGLYFINCKLVIPVERLHSAHIIYQLSIITTIVAVNRAATTACVLAHEDMKIYAYVGVFEATSRLLIAYLLTVSNSDKLVLYTSLYMAVDIILYLLFYIYCHRNYSECTFHFNYRKDTTMRLMSFVGWNALISMSTTFNQQGINIILNIFFGPLVNAARGVAFQVFNATQNLGFNIYAAVRPQLVKSYASGDLNYFTSLFYKSSKFSYYLMLMVCVPIVINVDYVLKLWLGNVPDYSNIFTAIIVLCVIVENLSNPIWAAIQAVGNLKKYSIITTVLVISILPISYACYMIKLPVYSAFVVYLIVRCIYLIISAKIVSDQIKEITLSDYCNKVINPALIVGLISFTSAFIVNQIHEISIMRFIINSVYFEIIIMICVYFIGITKDERIYLNNAIRSRVFKI